MATFANRLKELRNSKGITQKQMAEMLNMTERGFRGYEMGLSTPHHETFLKLADYFDVSLDYLAGRDNYLPLAVEPKVTKTRTSTKAMPEARALAYQDWKAGMPMNEIAVKHGLKPATVRQWAKRYWQNGT